MKKIYEQPELKEYNIKNRNIAAGGSIPEPPDPSDILPGLDL